jgi:hypothetical protein
MVRSLAAVLVASGLLQACSGMVVNETSLGMLSPDYRTISATYLRRTLINPYAVVEAEIGRPMPGSLAIDGAAMRGWVICYRANIRDDIGAYTGVRTNALLLVGRQIAGMTTDPDPASDEANCGEALYEPFREIEAMRAEAAVSLNPGGF